MLDKYIRLFLEVSFVDMLTQARSPVAQDDENNLERQKAREERLKRLEKDKNMTTDEYTDLVSHGNSTTTGYIISPTLNPGFNSQRTQVRQKRPKS